MGKRGHRTVFFEKDVSYYASTRDDIDIPGCELRLYDRWEDVVVDAIREIDDADVAMVTSYCQDGRAASRLLFEAGSRTRCFYDLDTPVTISRLRAGESVEYLPVNGLTDFDLVLSYTGGEALRTLSTLLGARRVAALYGSVDPEIHRPAAPVPEFAADLSYLGTYAADRQETLERLFIEAARQKPESRFVIGGAQYPSDFPWATNIHFVRHLPPSAAPRVLLLVSFDTKRYSPSDG